MSNSGKALERVQTERTRALLLIDHGSRVPAAHFQFQQVAQDLAERLRSQGKETIVHIAHMEIASPSFAEAVALCVHQGAYDILLIPCFLARGHHLSSDIPALIQGAKESHPDLTIRLAPPLYELSSFVDLLAQTAEDF